MKVFKKRQALALSAVLLSTGAHAGIPVFDGTSIVQQIIQVQNWVQQLQDMATSIQTQSDQLQNMTGQRMLGMILNDPTLQKYMPDNAGAIYSAIASTGYGGLTADARTLRDATRLYNCEGVSADFQAICSAALNKNAQDMAFNQSAFDTAGQRSDQIQTLMARINTTPDQKSIEELSARINAEGVAVANEANRLQIAAQIQQTNERLTLQREKEWFLAAAQRPSTLGAQHYTP